MRLSVACRSISASSSTEKSRWSSAATFCSSCSVLEAPTSVEVIRRVGDREFSLAVLGEGEFFGEMALFDQEVRSAAVRALGDVWVLTLEKRSFLRHVRRDPSLAFRILERMAHRIRSLDSRVVAMGT